MQLQQTPSKITASINLIAENNYIHIFLLVGNIFKSLNNISKSSFISFDTDQIKFEYPSPFLYTIMHKFPYFFASQFGFFQALFRLSPPFQRLISSRYRDKLHTKSIAHMLIEIRLNLVQ